MSEPNTTPAAQEATAAEPEKTFTQAEVNELISKEKARAVAKATKGIPSDEELKAFAAWKETHQTEQEKYNAVVKERDSFRAQVDAVSAELEQIKQTAYVQSKGISGDQAEFIAFKAAKMVDDKTTFEQAVDSLIPEKKPTVDWTAPLSGQTQKSTQSIMNDIIRNAAK